MPKKSDVFAETFISNWWKKHSQNPSGIRVIIQEPLQEGDIVHVYCNPAIDARDSMFRFQEPRYQNGYELPLCFFKEAVNNKTKAQLENELTIIKNLQGLEFFEGLAFMTQVFIIMVDFFRAKKGLDSILFWKTPSELNVDGITASKLEKKLINRPLSSLDKLLVFWNSYGAKFSKGFIKSPDGSCGRPLYTAIPPIWLDLQKLKEMYANESLLPRIQVAVESHLIPLIENLPMIAKQFSSAFTTAPNITQDAINTQPLLKNVFRKEGEYWTINYEGMKTPIRLKHPKGLSYIAYLLGNYGREFGVFDLIDAVEGRSVEKLPVEEIRMEDDEYQGKNIPSGVFRGLRKLKYRSSELDKELIEADRNNDLGAKQVLEEERQKLIDEIDSRDNKDFDNLKKHVSKNIYRAIKAIEKHAGKEHPLSKHLRSHLTPIKYPITYSPEQDIFWQT